MSDEQPAIVVSGDTGNRDNVYLVMGRGIAVLGAPAVHGSDEKAPFYGVWCVYKNALAAAQKIEQLRAKHEDIHFWIEPWIVRE